VENEVINPRDKSSWIICPTCEGDGQHSRNLGSFTQSEFEECFDDDSREDYFAGVYDRQCETCRGAGKIRESQMERHHDQCRRERMMETGRNEAGEPL
jgi:DnaJ-class molecular chaperone